MMIGANKKRVKMLRFFNDFIPPLEGFHGGIQCLFEGLRYNLLGCLTMIFKFETRFILSKLEFYFKTLEEGRETISLRDLKVATI